MTQHADVIIVGGGIVGLATAYSWSLRFPSASVLVLEKEAEVAAHQTGHNSGVLHTGVYYRPGSLKAINCRAGKLAMEAFCTEHDIPFRRCGKVIVATEPEELPRLQTIFERGQQNGVRCEMIGPERLKEIEPHAAGLQAVHVPEAGIINYRTVCRKLAEWIAEHGGQVLTSTRVLSIRQDAQSVAVETTAGCFRAERLVNCAGLHCDRVARRAGTTPRAKIVPFRGEYYELKPEAWHLCQGLIYPVPDPAFPFLGVHFTRMIDGSVECGPNAVLALAREGYRWRDINLGDTIESLTYGGFLRLAARYYRIGLAEIWRSISKRAFVKALQRLIPEIRSEHLHPAPAGVRAQAVAPDGAMVDDFLIETDRRVVHVANAPSPAATSSLNNGKSIVDAVTDTSQDVLTEPLRLVP